MAQTSDCLTASKRSSNRTLSLPSLLSSSLCVGHVYAAGVFIALAHDCKVMRSDRGWWCLNEIHIKRNFPVALIGMTKYASPLASHNA